MTETQAREPLTESLADAANQCRDYALIGEPSMDTLQDWADLFDRAATALEPPSPDPIAEIAAAVAIEAWRTRHEEVPE